MNITSNPFLHFKKFSFTKLLWRLWGMIFAQKSWWSHDLREDDRQLQRAHYSITMKWHQGKQSSVHGEQQQHMHCGTSWGAWVDMHSVISVMSPCMCWEKGAKGENVEFLVRLGISLKCPACLLAQKTSVREPVLSLFVDRRHRTCVQQSEHCRVYQIQPACYPEVRLSHLKQATVHSHRFWRAGWDGGGQLSTELHVDISSYTIPVGFLMGLSRNTFSFNSW